MDEYSSDTQWLSVVLFEPKAGRTKLKSLVKHDDPYCPFLYIESFTVKAEFRADEHTYSDVGAFALRKLLRHPSIVGSKVSSAIYVVDGREVMGEAEDKDFENYTSKFIHPFTEETKEEKAEKEHWENRLRLLSKKDAIQFLRNGFFQDKAYLSPGSAQYKILVASFHHWNTPLKSHAASLELPFCCEPSPKVVGPEGIHEELFKLVKKESSDDVYTNAENSVVKSRENDRKRSLIQELISRGASITQSRALHVAVANNCYDMVEYLLQIGHDAIDTFDEFGNTPLMLAAVSAAERSSKDGIGNTKIVDLLLAMKAKRDLCDPSGMTAYGQFINKRKEYDLMMKTLLGHPPPSASAPKHPSEEMLMQKLVPDSGPTEADLRGGEKNDGFVEYGDNDDYDNSYGGYDY
eukprot:CAMPEP_0203670520 /NCGR_PEP_ID=MMETSP0090-20130426/6566_1 /ASSEMBLY_ACC=CAM_ASM_001088 /TAXON_ID=426623 /ORGANISM="Chaetoceros affinis, Strain CCMP159" /LENGTH=406 /DNA_ID=CAMNT_0050535397 /DNA_START=189 /DNA_END=1409 /DNA_ORIENTATION=+